MKTILLVDDYWLFRKIWTGGIQNRFTFFHAATIAEAQQLYDIHSNINAIVMDACVGGWRSRRISWHTPLREWGFNTGPLIRHMRANFSGPIIAAPSQWWHWHLMREAGCTHHVWKWGVAPLLKKLLLP